MKLNLTIGGGTLAGRTFDLETGFLTVGRSDTCSVRLDPLTERIASKQHCFIEARADGFYLTDNQSTNGTFVNGERVDSVRLNSGDQIQFGANGVTAAVRIDTAGGQMDRDEFRSAQLEQFTVVAAREPQGLQASLANFGLSSMPAVKPETRSTGRYIGIAITIFAAIFLSLVVVLLMLGSVGFIPAVLAAVMAFLPAFLYLVPLVWLDRYDPEPLWLLATAFAWGALVAVVVSFIVNTVIGATAANVALAQGYSRDDAGFISSFVGAVISAPIFEEGSKGLGLVILLIFFRRYLDDVLDGIVFAGVIALGFATVENVLYYGRAIGEAIDQVLVQGAEVREGVKIVIFLFVLRGILSPFAHVTFTSMTGIGVGIARESHNMAVRLILPVVGYAVAVILHMIWNAMAVLGGLGGFAVGYIILEVPFFLVFVGFSLYIMRRQNKILTEMLALDIARGLIPQEHATIATSAFKSPRWVLGGLFNGKFKPRARYVRAIGKLGLSYWHIQRATAAQGETGSFQQNPILRDEVLAWRDKV
ncbi:MAG: PrsW family intramembrane metalloprotease [Chloracidobacterium sp.]|nr:PrsW family intramembrane metalloprotease [Chloracidobacterium sp.]